MTNQTPHAAFLKLVAAAQQRVGIHCLNLNIFAVGDVGCSTHHLNGGKGVACTPATQAQWAKELVALTRDLHTHGIRNLAVTHIGWAEINTGAESWDLGSGRGTSQRRARRRQHR